MQKFFSLRSCTCLATGRERDRNGRQDYVWLVRHYSRPGAAWKATFHSFFVFFALTPPSVPRTNKNCRTRTIENWGMPYFKNSEINTSPLLLHKHHTSSSREPYINFIVCVFLTDGKKMAASLCHYFWDNPICLTWHRVRVWSSQSRRRHGGHMGLGLIMASS